MVAVPASQGQELIDALKAAGVADAGIIGKVVQREDNMYLIFK